MVHRALEAAQALEANGVDAEVIDLRTLVPLDRDAVYNSVKKTGRLVVADEDYTSYGVTAEVIASVVERDVGMLKSTPKRVAYPDIQVPYSAPWSSSRCRTPTRSLPQSRRPSFRESRR